MHSSLPNQECPVGFGIQPALERVYSGVEDVVRDRLETSTVRDLLADILAQQSREDSPRSAHQVPVTEA
jgi:hypothetical protein